MERTNLLLGECTNDSMQNSTIVEENEILRVPDTYIHQHLYPSQPSDRRTSHADKSSSAQLLAAASCTQVHGLL